VKLYILKRLLFIFPTLLGILALNFFIIQLAPGGPVEQIIAQLQGLESGNLQNISGVSTESIQKTDREEIGIDRELIREIEESFGFDKPIGERFFDMVTSYLVFDFGDSYFHNRSVTDLIVEKLPVSISLGLLSTLLIYLISIPLGIVKALYNGSKFDFYTSLIVIIGNSIPVFLFGIILIILFSSGAFWELFPLRGAFSDSFEQMTDWEKFKDWIWHFTLPVTALVIGSFATMTLLVKNSFLDEIGKQYVITAKAKGLNSSKILYKHIFRNAMLIVVAGVPSAIIGVFLTGSVLIEVIFSLDGLGLLGFESILNRDYPVVFGTLYIFTLLSLVANLLSDLTYRAIDPRIDFEKR